MKKRKKKRAQKFAVVILEILIITAILSAIIGTIIWGFKTIYKAFTEESHAGNNESYIQQENQWNLMLVNKDNPIPQDYKIVLSETENGHKVDERIKEPLERMLSDARKDGIIPKITSSYRTHEEQQKLLEEKTQEYINQGMNESAATLKAQEWVAVPGTSEHETGLAVDISTADWDKQSAYSVWAWLEQNCHKYGFILRYTEEKEHITGIIPEPWHFRYVGINAATEIKEKKICLEEYLGNSRKESN